MSSTLQSDTLVDQYFQEIEDSVGLSAKEEVAIAERIKDGDEEALTQLVQANLRFVVSVAKGYQNLGLPLSDLINEGNLGLMVAAKRFDGSKGFKFISYAVWWIKQSIMQTIADQARTVRLPINKLSLLKDIAKVSRRLGQGREAAPDVEDIAAELDLPAQEVMDTMLNARSVRSLDEAFEDDNERSLMSVLVDNRQESPDLDVLRASTRDQLDDALLSLDDREIRIVRLYFGLDDHEALTLEQIGELMNLTRERVRQLKERALNKLRHPNRYQALLSLMD